MQQCNARVRRMSPANSGSSVSLAVRIQRYENIAHVMVTSLVPFRCRLSLVGTSDDRD